MHQVKVVWSELSILCTALKQYVIRMVSKKKKAVINVTHGFKAICLVHKM